MQFESLPEDTRKQIFAEHQGMTQNALVQVFGHSEREAALLVRDLWNKFDDAPRQEQNLLVHNDPVALACELARQNWSDIDQEKLDQFNSVRSAILEKAAVGFALGDAQK
jgi:hypothetical protein